MQHEPVAVGDQLPGVVARILQRKGISQPHGLMVDLGFNAFMPRAVVPSEFRDDLRRLVGKHLMCTVLVIDEQRRTVVVTPTKFLHEDELIEAKSMSKLSFAEGQIEVLLDNLKGIVPQEDRKRYLSVGNAKRILTAIIGENLGDDVSVWESRLRELGQDLE